MPELEVDTSLIVNTVLNTLDEYGYFSADFVGAKSYFYATEYGFELTHVKTCPRIYVLQYTNTDAFHVKINIGTWWYSGFQWGTTMPEIVSEDELSSELRGVGEAIHKAIMDRIIL